MFELGCENATVGKNGLIVVESAAGLGALIHWQKVSTNAIDYCRNLFIAAIAYL